MLFALANLFVVLGFYEKIMLATILLGIVTLTGFMMWRSHIPIWIFVVGGLYGPLAEMVAIRTGIWNYTLTNVGTVPS